MRLPKIQPSSRKETFAPKEWCLFWGQKSPSLQYMCNDNLLAATQERHYWDYSGVTSSWIAIIRWFWSCLFPCCFSHIDKKCRQDRKAVRQRSQKESFCSTSRSLSSRTNLQSTHVWTTISTSWSKTNKMWRVPKIIYITPARLVMQASAVCCSALQSFRMCQACSTAGHH